MTETTALRAAAFWMTGAIVSFSSMAVAGRAVSVELPTFELMLYRSVIGILIVLVLATAFGTRSSIRPNLLPVHILRNLSHFSGQNLWFYALTMAPLAQVFALEFTSPIWVAIAAPLLLNERLTKTRIASALLGFCGVLLVARPGLDGIGAGQVAGAAAAIGFAGSAIFTKLLTRTETITSILFWLTLMQAILGLATASLDGHITWPSATSWPWLVLISCAGLTAHFCLTKALSLAPATLVIPFDFLRLPVIALVGMAFYGEPLDSFVLFGAIVIFGANYLNIWTEARK